MAWKLGLSVVVTLILLSVTVTAGSFDMERIEAIEGDIDRILDQLQSSWRDAFDDVSLKTIARRVANREMPIDGRRIVQSLFNHFIREVRAGFSLSAQLLGIGLLLAVLGSLRMSDRSDAPVNIAHLVCFLVVGRIAIGAFMIALTTAQSVISDLSSTILAMLPVLAGVVVASGAYATAGLFHPFMLTVVYYAKTLVTDLVLPLLMTAGIIDLVSHISPVHRLSGVAGLFRSVGLGILGLGLCLVIGTSTVLGASSMAADGVGLRSIKYAAGTFIPVAGKMFADAAELVLSSSIVVKNSAGIVAAIAIVLAAGLPLVKLVALAFTFRLSAALAGPLGLEDMAKLISAVANCIVYFAVAVAAVTIMFFIVLAAMIGASNAVTMIR